MARVTTVKKLAEGLSISLGEAKELRWVLKYGTLENLVAARPAVAEWYRSLHNPVGVRHHEAKMVMANAMLEMHGVEAFSLHRGREARYVEYLNTGDTYASTLVAERRETGWNYTVTDYGTIIETAQNNGWRTESV